MRNLIAAEMGSKFKSKRFSNDRGNRRASSNRNKFDWRSDMDELDLSDETHDNDIK